MEDTSHDTYHPWNRHMSTAGPGVNKIQDRLDQGKYGDPLQLKLDQYHIMKSSASINAREGKEVHSCDEHFAVFLGDKDKSSYQKLKDHVSEYHKADGDESGANIGYLLTLSEEKRRQWA